MTIQAAIALILIGSYWLYALNGCLGRLCTSRANWPALGWALLTLAWVSIPIVVISIWIHETAPYR